MGTEPRRVGVVGSGTMGAGIAECATLAGHAVALRSRSDARATATRARLEANLERRVAKGTLSPDDAAAALGRVEIATDLEVLAAADVVMRASRRTWPPSGPCSPSCHAPASTRSSSQRTPRPCRSSSSQW